MDKGLLLKQDVIRRQGLIERGLAALKPETKLESNLLGSLKKTFDPKRLATSFALRKMGLGWLNPFLGIGSWLFGKYRDRATDKKPALTFDPAEASQLELYADRFPTDVTKRTALKARDAYEPPVSTQIARGTGLESGAELLGLKERDDLSDIEGHRADVSQSDIDVLGKYNPKQDVDTIRMIEKLNPTITDQEIKDVLQKKITSPTGKFAAHGGRIDKPLMGRNRYI